VAERLGLLTAEHTSGTRLTPAQIEEVWLFLSRFVKRSRPAFEAALPSVQDVVLFRDGAGALRGFVGNKLLDVVWQGRSHVIFFTAWTWIDPAARGHNLLQGLGLKMYLRTRIRHPWARVYWMMFSSTYKSYLLLPRNFVEFWPRRGAEWPERERELVRVVMEQDADPDWDPQAGVVRRRGASRYREGVVADEPEALQDPDVRFYAERNPGQDQGDTLIALCPLSARNLWSMVSKAVRRRRGRAGAAPRSA